MDIADKSLIDIQDVHGFATLHFAASSSWQVIHELLNWRSNLLCHTSDELSTALYCALIAWDGPRNLSNL